MALFAQFKKELPSAAGKTFVITGTTSGTGYIAARTVAELGGEVVLLNRTSPRSEASLQKLQREVPNGTFVAIPCDLQDFSSVRQAAQKIREKYSKLYCLANNAGIMATPDEATIDGYDTQMQTNHLSHFLLTKELFPLLDSEAKENGDARIIQHSSVARHSTVNRGLEEKYFGQNGGNLGGSYMVGLNGAPMHRYQQTKLANSVFGYALHDKLQASGSNVRSIIAHPGLSKTELFNNLDVNFRYQPAEDGAMGIITGMMKKDSQSGVLYGPKGSAGPPVPNPPQSYEVDGWAKEMLWRTSEAAIGAKFDI